VVVVMMMVVVVTHAKISAQMTPPPHRRRVLPHVEARYGLLWLAYQQRERSAVLSDGAP
jgi:hypothetical protein